MSLRAKLVVKISLQVCFVVLFVSVIAICENISFILPRTVNLINIDCISKVELSLLQTYLPSCSEEVVFDQLYFVHFALHKCDCVILFFSHFTSLNFLFINLKSCLKL